jgi:hypothetical protein
MIFAEIKHKKFAEIKQNFLYFYDYFHGFTVKSLFPLMNFISVKVSKRIWVVLMYLHCSPPDGEPVAGRLSCTKPQDSPRTFT